MQLCGNRTKTRAYRRRKSAGAERDRDRRTRRPSWRRTARTRAGPPPRATAVAAARLRARPGRALLVALGVAAADRDARRRPRRQPGRPRPRRAAGAGRAAAVRAELPRRRLWSSRRQWTTPQTDRAVRAALAPLAAGTAAAGDVLPRAANRRRARPARRRRRPRQPRPAALGPAPARLRARRAARFSRSARAAARSSTKAASTSSASATPTCPGAGRLRRLDRHGAAGRRQPDAPPRRRRPHVRLAPGVRRALPHLQLDRAARPATASTSGRSGACSTARPAPRPSSPAQSDVYQLSGPDQALVDARSQGRVAAQRMLLVGGEGSALLLGFALVAAMGLRRGLAERGPQAAPTRRAPRRRSGCLPAPRSRRRRSPARSSVRRAGVGAVAVDRPPRPGSRRRSALPLGRDRARAGRRRCCVAGGDGRPCSRGVGARDADMRARRVRLLDVAARRCRCRRRARPRPRRARRRRRCRREATRRCCWCCRCSSASSPRSPPSASFAR